MLCYRVLLLFCLFIREFLGNHAWTLDRGRGIYLESWSHGVTRHWQIRLQFIFHVSFLILVRTS